MEKCSKHVCLGTYFQTKLVKMKNLKELVSRYLMCKLLMRMLKKLDFFLFLGKFESNFEMAAVQIFELIKLK